MARSYAPLVAVTSKIGNEAIRLDQRQRHNVLCGIGVHAALQLFLATRRACILAHGRLNGFEFAVDMLRPAGVLVRDNPQGQRRWHHLQHRYRRSIERQNGSRGRTTAPIKAGPHSADRQ